MPPNVLYKAIIQIHLDGKLFLNYRTADASIKEGNLYKNHKL